MAGTMLMVQFLTWSRIISSSSGTAKTLLAADFMAMLAGVMFCEWTSLSGMKVRRGSEVRSSENGTEREREATDRR